MKNRAALLVLAALAPALAFSAEPPRSVSVSGQCRKEVTPDRGSVTVTAEFRENDLKSAASKAMAAYERVRDAVKKLNLEKLELTTSEYSLTQIREWEKNQNVFKGYQARMGLRVTSASVSRLGEVLSIATREGMQDVGGLVNFLSIEKKLEGQTACLEIAAQQARLKAEKLAGALGAQLGPVLTLNENWESFSPPHPRSMIMKSMSIGSTESAPPPTIEAGLETLAVTVQATFGLK